MKINPPIRILMAKPGLDGHDRGIKVLAAAYRDAGMDVIYLGLRQTPESVVKIAIQEGVDVIALSILSGAHITIFSRVMDLIKENDLSNILVTGGGGSIGSELCKEILKHNPNKLFVLDISEINIFNCVNNFTLKRSHYKQFDFIRIFLCNFYSIDTVRL